MDIAVASLRRAHFDEAAALLTARLAHRVPVEDGGASVEPAMRRARQALRETLLTWTGGGIVAIKRGHVVGYLVATLSRQAGDDSAFPTSAGLASVGLGGHAAVPHDADATLTALYSAIAPRWLQAGCGTHLVDVLVGEAEVQEVWANLGFIRHGTVALRSITRLPALRQHDVRIRRATVEDLDQLITLREPLATALAAPPIFMPRADVDPLSARQQAVQLLNEPSTLMLLAARGDRPCGYLTMVPHAPLVREALPTHTIWIDEVYAAADVPGTGVALLAAGLRWAAERGYRHCATAWLSANRRSAAICTRLGFRPVALRLQRTLPSALRTATAATERAHGPA